MSSAGFCIFVGEYNGLTTELITYAFSNGESRLRTALQLETVDVKWLIEGVNSLV